MALRATAKPPPQSPEREMLAEAIEQARAATARREALARALQSAEAAVLNANGAVADAEAGVETARADAAGFLVATAAGNAGDPPRTIRQARDRLQDCTDALDTARAARDELRRQQAADDGKPALFQMRLREAVAAVLKSEWQPRADAMVAEINEALAVVLEKAELVRLLADVGLFPGARNSLSQIVGPVGAVSRLPVSGLIPGSEPARARGAARFRAMFDAPQADADAPLP